MGRKPRDRDRQAESLTEAELELMNIIWRRGPCTVAEVLSSLPSHRALAYTTVSTIVRILAGKGFVKVEKDGRGHRYVPLVAKETYQAHSVSHLVNQVFDGTPATLVRSLLNHKSLKDEDLAAIRALLDQKGE